MILNKTCISGMYGINFDFKRNLEMLSETTFYVLKKHETFPIPDTKEVYSLKIWD